jgi:hypothetical protein
VAVLRDRRFVALTGLYAAVVTLHLLTPQLDADQAVTGLMGLHVLRGEFPVFFWGQHHAGVPESYLAAVSFALLGVSRLTLNLVPALTGLALLVCVYRTGTALFGRGAGLLAMLFVTVVSGYASSHYALARAYYIEQVLLGQVVLLAAAVWLRRPAGAVADARPALAMGLAGGLGLYCGPQVLVFLVPAALWLLLAAPGLVTRRAAGLGLVAFVAGSAPLWAYNLAHDWATLGAADQLRARGTLSLTLRRFAEHLAIFVGAAEPDGPALAALSFAALRAMTIGVVLAGACALLGSRVLRGIGRLRRDRELLGECLVLAVVAAAVAAVLLGRYVRAPRYFLPLLPALALVLARATQLVGRRRPAVAVILAAAYLLAVGVDLARGLTVLWPEERARYREARSDDAALLGLLDAQDLRHAYVLDYWLGPRLTFDAATRPGRRAVVFARPFADRRPAYARAVDGAERPAYVLEADAPVFEAWMRAAGVVAAQDRVGPYTVFRDFVPPPPVTSVRRRELAVAGGGWREVGARGHGATAGVLDGRLNTGWASVSGPPATAWIDIDLGRPRVVAGVTVITPRPETLPSRLAVTGLDGDPREVLGAFEPRGVTVTWANGAPRVRPGHALTVRFPATAQRRIRLTGSGPRDGWRVSEIFVLVPASTGVSAPPVALEAARSLEAAGGVREALDGYLRVMRAEPDEPAGYAEAARLAWRLRRPLAEIDAEADRIAASPRPRWPS